MAIVMPTSTEWERCKFQHVSMVTLPMKMPCTPFSSAEHSQEREDGTGSRAQGVHARESLCAYASWQGGMGPHLCIYSVCYTRKKTSPTCTQQVIEDKEQLEGARKRRNITS